MIVLREVPMRYRARLARVSCVLVGREAEILR